MKLLKSIKKKLYFFFVRKNKKIEREYEAYVKSHAKEHKKERWKHWIILVGLNFHYRILRKKPFLLKENERRHIQRVAQKNAKKIAQNAVGRGAKLQRYRFIHGAWNSFGPTDELMRELALWEKSRWAWENNGAEVFLIYATCLLEKGEKDEALRVLKKVADIYGLDKIYRYMPLAQMMVELGCEEDDIVRSAIVFHHMEKNRKAGVLEKLLENKRIAVVGNGPLEIGKGLGKEIDEHDIVIRFNNFQLEGFEHDYGERTDIWVRNANIVTNDRDILDKVKMIIWEPDYWNMHIQHDHLDILFRDICIDSTKLCYLHGIRKRICEESNILSPTTGAQMLYYLQDHKKLFKELNYYGFSFLDKESDASYEHYYNESTLAQEIHQPEVEMRFLRNLILNQTIKDKRKTQETVEKYFEQYIESQKMNN